MNIEEEVKDFLLQTSQPSEDFVIFTGLNGMRQFDTEMNIEICGNDLSMLKDLIRRTSEKKYKMEDRVSKLERLWFVKLYYFIIKISNLIKSKI